MKSKELAIAAAFAIISGICFCQEPPSQPSASQPTTETAAMSQPAADTPAQTRPVASRPARGAVESVLKRIPADAMGFAVVNSFKKDCKDVQAFLTASGLANLLSSEYGIDSDTDLSSQIKNLLQLGEGFNSRGGLAVVFLNPDKFGYELVNAFGLESPASQPASEPASEPASRPADEIEPLVILLPGWSVDAVLEHFEPEIEEGDIWRFLVPGEDKWFAVQAGDYIAISHSTKALAAITKIENSAADALPKDHADLIARSNLSLHVNFTVGAPSLLKVIQALEKSKEENPDSDADPLTAIFDLPNKICFESLIAAKYAIAQANDLTISLKSSKERLAADALISFKPDSPSAKVIKSFKTPDKSPVSLLPNVGYVIAAGKVFPDSKTAAEQTAILTETVKKLLELSTEECLEFPKAIEEKMTGFESRLIKQLDSAKFVLGRAPDNAGMFGAAIVLESQSADKIKAVLADLPPLAEEICREVLGKNNDDLAKLTFAYKKAAEKIDGISVDVLEMSHPDLETDTETKEHITSIFGEDKIRIFITAVDEKTVVITTGGGKNYLKEALKAAKGKGDLEKDKEVAKACDQMPDNLMLLMLFNVSNLYELINAASAQRGEPDVLPPFQCKSPIIFGAGAQDNSIRMKFILPADVVRELTKTFLGDTGEGE